MIKRNKIYWGINLICSGIIFIVLLIVFLVRYFKVGTPVNANWSEEICMYLFIWPIISVVVCGALYSPLRALADYIAKKKGYNEESM